MLFILSRSYFAVDELLALLSELLIMENLWPAEMLASEGDEARRAPLNRLIIFDGSVSFRNL